MQDVLYRDVFITFHNTVYAQVDPAAAQGTPCEKHSLVLGYTQLGSNPRPFHATDNLLLKNAKSKYFLKCKSLSK